MQDGFLLINKQQGWTSRDVCNKLEHKFDEKKVGHNGTLDPFATGLLLVAFGRATRTLSFIENTKKTYVAKLVFGKKTSTGDLTGNIIEERKVVENSKEDIDKIFKSLLGNQKQIPPMTSAIHFEGRKLYELAHEGKEVKRKERDIFIHDLKLLSLEKDFIIFEATVSKGTYIRTLGETIADKLNNVGYLESLNRTMIGDLNLKNAKSINEVTEDDFFGISDIVKSYLQVMKIGDEDTILKVKHGGKLSLKLFDKLEKEYLIVDANDNSLAIYCLKEKEYYYCGRNLI